MLQVIIERCPICGLVYDTRTAEIPNICDICYQHIKGDNLSTNPVPRSADTYTTRVGKPILRHISGLGLTMPAAWEVVTIEQAVTYKYTSRWRLPPTIPVHDVILLTARFSNTYFEGRNNWVFVEIENNYYDIIAFRPLEIEE